MHYRMRFSAIRSFLTLFWLSSYLKTKVSTILGYHYRAINKVRIGFGAPAYNSSSNDAPFTYGT